VGAELLHVYRDIRRTDCKQQAVALRKVLRTRLVIALCINVWKESDVWLTVHRNSVCIRKTNYMSLFVFFISLLIVAQHVSGNHVPIIRS